MHPSGGAEDIFFVILARQSPIRQSRDFGAVKVNRLPGSQPFNGNVL